MKVIKHIVLFFRVSCLSIDCHAGISSGRDRIGETDRVKLYSISQILYLYFYIKYPRR